MSDKKSDLRKKMPHTDIYEKSKKNINHKETITDEAFSHHSNDAGGYHFIIMCFNVAPAAGCGC